MALFGVQTERLTDASLDRLIAHQIPLLKPINQFDRILLERYKSSVPGAKLYPRVWVDDIDLSQADGLVARQVADRVSAALEPIHDLVDATFFLNEVLQSTPKELARHATLTLAYCDLMEPRGYTVIGGGFGVGNPPDPKDIVHFAPALRRLTLWSRHAYGAPTMIQPDLPHYTLRHRLERAALLGVKDPSVLKPLILGECGVDGGVLGSHHQDQGYRSFLASKGNNTYAAQLGMFGVQLRDDPYVTAALVFGYAMTPRWHSFDLQGDEAVLAELSSANVPLDVGPGFRDWQALEPDLIGGFQESETYHDVDDRKVSLCWTNRGLLRWVARTGTLDFLQNDGRLRKYLGGSPRWLW